MKRLKNTLIFMLAGLCSGAQISAYFNVGSFNVPGQQPFVETYLTIAGSSLRYKTEGNQYQSSVNILATIYQDTNIVKATKYNLSGPLFGDTMQIPAFIDNQRYSLPNGVYTVKLKISDNQRPKQKPLDISQKFVVNYNQKDLQSSSIQIVESYKKAEKPSAITKSGLDLVPYSVNYFPESQNEIAFYFEAYNAESVLGNNAPFIFYYYIENQNTYAVLNSFGSFKKQTAATVNPLLGKIDISKLGTGNYNLVIEIKDRDNKIKLQSKYFFQRLNKAADAAAVFEMNEKRSVSEYFGSCDNADTLKMFVECLWPIANGVDKERIINQSVKKDKELMKNFVIDFWERRAADTANPLKMWGQYYQQVQKAMALFKCGKQPGYYTERGRVFLQYGPPNQRSEQNYDLNTFPYEIWQYYRITDQTNGQFFTNRKFVFVNKNIADNCHTLIHSDMNGEIKNDRWRFELTRRNNNGIANPDNNKPAGTDYNQFDDIYANPR